MIATLKSMTGKTNASASVVDGKLILSFPHAKTPVVWQMDLAQAKSSALEVVETGKDGAHALTLKTQKGEKVEVASFETREDALEGLMAVSKALENAHGQIQSVQIAANEDKALAVSAPRKKGSVGRWVAGIVAVLILVALVGMMGSMAPRTPSGLQTTANTSPNAAPGAAQNSAGVPVSADDFLNSL